MKKTFALLVSFLLCGSAALCADTAVSLVGTVVTPERLAPILDEVEHTYHVSRAAEAPAIDGNPGEWEDVPAMVLDQKERTGGAWDGVEDLGGAMRLLWDDKGVYFCLQVTDDVHAAPNADRGFWENDCCQFAFDAYMNGPKGTYDSKEISLWVSDTPDGPKMGFYRLPGAPSEKEGVLEDRVVKMSVLDSGTRVYEWLLTWDELAPVSPWLFGRCGFAYTLNDNDGQGFAGGAFWAHGILWGQDAAKFGQVVFDGAAGRKEGQMPIPPEPRVSGPETPSQWINVEGIDPFCTARVLLSSEEATERTVTVRVYAEGRQEVLATDTVKVDLQPGKPAMVAWDLSVLPSASYDIAYELEDGAVLPRETFKLLDVSHLAARAGEFRAKYGLDRPWDDMRGAPDTIRRHRGLVAAVLQWTEPNSSTWNERLGMNLNEQLLALGDAVDIISALDAGEDYLGRQRGEFWAAYYSPSDGSGQHFVMQLPDGFDPGKPCPLIVRLHGKGGRPKPNREAVLKEPYILVQPWGRGDSSYIALGEHDVLAVIDYVKEWYKIDADRVYLTGGSMGGFGTWRMICRYPDLFAAAGPICGGGAWCELENLRHVPVFSQHGAKDWIVSIDQSRVTVEQLQRLNYPVVHKEFPDAGHNIPHPYDQRTWMMSHRRNNRPRAITYTFDTIDRGRVHWLSVRRVVDPHLRTTVNANVAGNGDGQTLTLLAPNVAVLELDTAAMPIDRTADLLVQVGNDLLRTPAPLAERLYVMQQNGQWSTTNQWVSPPAGTRPYRPGAAAELFTGEPLLVVYGTQGSEARDEALLKGAGSIALFPGSWGEMVIGRIPMKADIDLTREDLDHFNLVVLGGARDNLLTAELLPDLPVTFTDRSELVAGPREPVDMRDAGLLMAYYNPLAPHRLVFLVATDEPGEAADRWYEHARGLLTGSAGFDRADTADLVVQVLRSRLDPERGGPERRRMQFTHGWQWRAVDGADRKLRRKMDTNVAITRLELEAMRRANGADFALTGRGTDKDERLDRRWFTLADAMTARSPRKSIVAETSGEDLIAIYEKWGTEGELTTMPDYRPRDIDPGKTYRIAVYPHSHWMFQRRERLMINPRLGVPVPHDVVWHQMFGD